MNEKSYSFQQSIDTLLAVATRANVNMSRDEIEMISYWKGLRKIAQATSSIPGIHERMMAIAKAFGSDGFTGEEAVYCLGITSNTVRSEINNAKKLGLLRSEVLRRERWSNKGSVARYYYVDWEKKNGSSIKSKQLGEGSRDAGTGEAVSG